MVRKKKEQDTSKMSLAQRIKARIGDNVFHNEEIANEFGVVDVVPTGILSLDAATGVGGLPTGRMVEIYGAESSGKTTLTLHVIAEAQKLGKVVGFVDAEHALDIDYASRLGVNVNDIYLVQPDSGEDALNAVQVFAEEGVGVIVVDSVAALTPKAELEGEMGTSHMGLQARLMSQACRKLTSIISSNNCLLIWINQTRQTIGGYSSGAPVTTGGNALKFYSSIRINVLGGSKDAGPKDGKRPTMRIVKNKLAPPYREAEADLLFGYGFDKTYQVLDIGEMFGLVEKKGAWWSVGGTQFHGKDAAVEGIRKNPELLSVLWDKCREAVVGARRGSSSTAHQGGSENA